MQPPKQTYQPKIPLSICLIAKNERRNIPGFHKSLEQILCHPQDEVVLLDTGSVDNTEAEARKRGWRVERRDDLCTLDYEAMARKWLGDEGWQEHTKHAHYKGGLLRSFAEARQISFSMARNEVCMWLDLDDVIINPEMLRPYIDEVFSEGRRGAIMLNYEYAHGKDGKCTTELWRERIVTKSDWEWKGACHETLLPRSDRGQLVMAREPNLPCAIYHKAPKGHKFSDLRNYLILRSDLENRHDPRTLFYLGNACRGMERHQESLDFYHQFVKQSGNKDDVFAARLSSCGCLNAMGKHYRAIDECKAAQKVNPADPRGYYFEADCWLRLGHYRNVLLLIKIGDEFEMPDTLHAVDPITVNYQPAAMGAIAAREMGNVELCRAYAERAIKERPDFEGGKQGYEDMMKWASAEELGSMIYKVLQHAAKNPVEAMRHLVISPHLAAKGFGCPEDEFYGQAGKTVAFWCGSTAEAWGPNSGDHGIGASEKMVVDMAKRLAARDYDVTVYCNLSCKPGEYDGVHWKQTANFNADLYRDYLVIWRVPAVLESMAFRAGKIFVWMHDVGSNAVWTDVVLARVDKVLFLSEFQRSLHPAVPDDKVFITRNGIDLERHLYDGTPKQKKILYISSPDRGWLTAIKLFRESGLDKQGYTLHMFYGFGKNWQKMAGNQEYGQIVELGKEMCLHEYEAQCLDACDGKTVINRGRCGWDVIAKELNEAEIWFYPTQFDEISCVSAMEAMAAGCKVVATEHAALKETLADYPLLWSLDGHKKSYWSTMLANVDCCGETNDMEDITPRVAAEHARRFDIEALADSWVKELFACQLTS